MERRHLAVRRSLATQISSAKYGYFGPDISPDAAETTDEGFPIGYAVPATFGQVGQILLVAGDVDDEVLATHFFFKLQQRTPSSTNTCPAEPWANSLSNAGSHLRLTAVVNIAGQTRSLINGPRLSADGELNGWPRLSNDWVEESRDFTGQDAGESQVGAT